MPLDDRVPFPLEQDSVREQGSASLAAAEVPAQARFASFVSADARAPPPVAEPASSASYPQFVDTPSASAVRPRLRFADPPVAGPSARGPAEEEDDDGASVVSNPPGCG